MLGVEAGQVSWLSRVLEGSSGELPAAVSEAGLRVEDLRTRCGLEPAGKDDRRQLLVVEQAGEEVAFLVDEVADLISVDLDRQIRPLPRLVEVHKRWQQLWGICRWEQEPVIMVDLQYQPPDTGE